MGNKKKVVQILVGAGADVNSEDEVNTANRKVADL